MDLSPLQRLTKGKNSWSLSEVVHAMVLLSHFHSLSSFVFSCGLTQKLDSLSSPKLKSPPVLVSSQEPGIPVINITANTPMDPQKTVLAEISLNNAEPDYNGQTAAANNGGGVGAGAGAGGVGVNANATADGPGAVALNGYLGKWNGWRTFLFFLGFRYTEMRDGVL